ncbi:MAG: cytochrome C [Gammaproteobacteria bacterium]|nr:cytochrome C [Gammaproteobacteria bacterium]
MPARRLRRAVLAACALAAAGAAADEEPAGHPLGWQDYVDHCAACHGADGHGHGPLAAELRRAPRDLTRLAADNGGSFPETLVYQVIDGRRIVGAHGSSQMPIWGRRFRLEGETEMEIELTITALIDYLESLQRP